MTTNPDDGPQVILGGRTLQNEDAPFFAKFPPQTTAFLRGLSEAAAGGVITAVAAYLEAGPDVPEGMIVYVPIIIVLLRTLEGTIDSKSEV